MVEKYYCCAKCGATNCKLWRECYTFDPQLLCCNCAAVDQGTDISDIDEEGNIAGKYNSQTDTIGWYVPAIPCDGGFWGYTSVPQEGVDWWTALPTKPKGEMNA